MRTASYDGFERDFNAITTASASGTSKPARGTPSSTTVHMPWRVSVFPMSVAPVKSSAMQPSIKDIGSSACSIAHRSIRVDSGGVRDFGVFRDIGLEDGGGLLRRRPD